MKHCLFKYEIQLFCRIKKYFNITTGNDGISFVFVKWIGKNINPNNVLIYPFEKTGTIGPLIKNNIIKIAF